MKFYFVILSFGIFCINLTAQQVGYISDFKLTEIDQKILITWTIDSGQTCNGIDVLRATDGVDFQEIGHFSGVCGSVSKPVTYTFLDEAPKFNAENSYRLKLGSTGYSIIEKYYLIGVPVGSAWVYPNPFKDHFKLKIDNPNGFMKIFEITNISGKVLHKSETNLSEVVFSGLNLQKGIYLLRVHDPKTNELTVNRLVVI